ncbi:ATP synthase F1 subunit gamma [Prolixibacteraceae bacterium JC049]|nr:ATP synthase F1 subunit gamma [Prolixibacteraceae bacterium JC049]
MASLKEIRTRISTVTTTRQVTSAMKMVSAAKLKKAQDAIMQIRPYADKLHEILADLTPALNNIEDSIYTNQRVPEKVLLVVISSNRGLCGSFNSNIVKQTIRLIKTKYFKLYKAGKLDCLAIGKQGEKQLKSRKISVSESNHEIFDQLNFENVNQLAQELMTSFSSGQYDRIELVYNQFKNAAVQICVSEQFLPVEMDEKAMDNTPPDFIYEPSQEHIVTELIPRSLKIQLFKTLLDSNAAEHGARMTAMHQATDNASELLDELRLHYNQARQTAITNEILEITGGAEALNS